MKKQSILFIIVAGLFWGTSGLFVHALSPLGFTAPQMIVMRGLVSALAMVVYALIFNRGLFRITLQELFQFICSGFCMFLTAVSYYISMQMSSVATAVILMYTAPVLVMIFSVLFLGESMTKAKFVSVVAMLIGCCLVSGIVGGLKFHFLGVVFGLLAGVAYSSYNIFAKLQMRRKYNPVSASMYTFIFMAVFALCFGEPVTVFRLTFENPVQVLPLFIGIGLTSGVIPYFLYTLSLKSLPVGTAASLAIVEPMSATVYSILFLHEPLSLPAVIGIIMILGAVFLLSKTVE